MYLHKLAFLHCIDGATVLHFARKQHFYRLLLEHWRSIYIASGLSPKDKGFQRIDITDIPYLERYFDFVRCKHVHEHVTDEGAAVAEIHRVLCPSGYGVFQTP
jgi:2-polyprenyl-3-methyl-5-hydroxy-6-metoxy-1,4-benzoquinol methylase